MARVIELNKSVTESNDKDAEELRSDLKEQGVFLVNIMSSPGSGKTTLLSRTISDMKETTNIAVLEADIDSDVDAVKIEDLGAKAVQVHTDGMCHMDAGMTRRGMEGMDLDGVQLAFLENVGNLICPAEFDTGAHKNVMILSVPEGDDKPLKYPLMFSMADALLITKMDTKEYFTFDLDLCIDHVKKLNKDIQIFPVSAKTGEGMDAWENWLRDNLF
ncbi:MAG: hydrogenase nickel incorporation protein HypB [Lachnospiraceae bacterium]|nr:hydrogenase nickel incorporation protein HypB [Lachnospiraceae bacterium]